MNAIRSWLVCLLLLPALAGCFEEDENTPYVEFGGGGFIFNYRLAQATYGFVANVKRPIPAGTVLEAKFENPDGAEPLVVVREAQAGMIRYAFESPPLQGVRADRDYRVELRLLEPESREVLARYERSFRSDLDQKVLPSRPLTVGPGYQRNPADQPAEAPN